MTAARFYSSTAGSMELQADITSSSTTMQVDSVVGLPGTTPFTVVIDPGTTEEIVDVTGVAGTSLTIVRGQDGSPAQAHTAGAVVRHMATARDFREPQEHIGSTAAHGTTGAIVGTSDTQTLTNKNLTSGTNTFPSSLATDAELAAHAAASTAVHGVSGSVVGTSSTQALTNKDLTSGTNTFPTSLATLTGAQTLTNKTISGASNTLSNIPESAVTGLTTDLSSLGTRVGAIETNLGSQTTFVASSAACDGKRLHWGTASFTTSGASGATVTHGAGFTPTVVTVAGNSTWRLIVDTVTATTFRVRAYDSTNTPITLAVSLMYFCGE